MNFKELYERAEAIRRDGLPTGLDLSYLDVRVSATHHQTTGTRALTYSIYTPATSHCQAPRPQAALALFEATISAEWAVDEFPSGPVPETVEEAEGVPYG